MDASGVPPDADPTHAPPPRRRLLAVPNAVPLAFLGGFVLLVSAMDGIYAARELRPSPLFVALANFGFLWGVDYWVRADARRLGRALPLDYGLALFYAWPIAGPWYMVTTRGARGLLSLLGFVLFCGACWAIWALVFALAGGSWGP